MEVPQVGSLAVPAPQYRESMGTGEAAGVLLGLRRTSGHIYYPSSEHSYWVPVRQISSIPPEVLPDDCLERLLSDLLLFVRADECELLEIGERSLKLAIESPGLSREELHELEQRLSGTLSDYALEPGSMRAVLLRLDLTDLPDAAGAGR